MFLNEQIGWYAELLNDLVLMLSVLINYPTRFPADISTDKKNVITRYSED